MCVLNCWAPSTPLGPAHKASIVGIWLPAHHQLDRSCCSDQARKAHPKFRQMPVPHPYQAREGSYRASVDSEKKGKAYQQSWQKLVQTAASGSNCAQLEVGTGQSGVACGWGGIPRVSPRARCRVLGYEPGTDAQLSGTS